MAWPVRTKFVSTRDHCRVLWKIYLKACICHLDYHSSCDCEIYQDAATLLQDLLGVAWIEICKEEFGDNPTY